MPTQIVFNGGAKLVVDEDYQTVADVYTSQIAPYPFTRDGAPVLVFPTSIAYLRESTHTGSAAFT